MRRRKCGNNENGQEEAIQTDNPMFIKHCINGELPAEYLVTVSLNTTYAI